MISLQDQQKINKFARQNQKLEDIKDDIKVLTLRGGFIDEHSKLSLTSPNKVVNSELQARQNEIVTLTDAASDVEELALTMDDDEKVINWDWLRGTKR